MPGVSPEALSAWLDGQGEPAFRAKQILDNWADYLPRFVKVMPVEYRRALREIEESQTRGAAE